jgi:hypothetical protein
MGKDPAFLFYPGDYLRDTQCLSEKAQVAYDRIMCEHMRNSCKDVSNITVSKDRVNFFTKRLNDSEKEDLMHVLVECNSHYQIEWVAASIAKRKAYSESRAKNRSKSSQKDMKTYDKTSLHMEDEIEIEDENQKESKHKYGKEKNVLLTEREYKKFIDDFGGEKAARAIDILSEYLATYKGGSKYRSHYRVLRKWPAEEAGKENIFKYD